jgi:Flp pilus assembly pilin Flp
MLRHSTRGLRVYSLAQRFSTNQSGATALEYAVLAATLALVIIAGMEGLDFRIAIALAKSASLALTAAFSH